MDFQSVPKLRISAEHKMMTIIKIGKINFHSLTFQWTKPGNPNPAHLLSPPFTLPLHVDSIFCSYSFFLLLFPFLPFLSSDEEINNSFSHIRWLAPRLASGARPSLSQFSSFKSSIWQFRAPQSSSIDGFRGSKIVKGFRRVVQQAKKSRQPCLLGNKKKKEKKS